MTNEVQYRKLAAYLKKKGWTETGQRGSHVKWLSPEGKLLVVPKHKVVSPGVVRHVIKALGGDVPDEWK